MGITAWQREAVFKGNLDRFFYYHFRGNSRNISRSNSLHFKVYCDKELGTQRKAPLTICEYTVEMVQYSG